MTAPQRRSGARGWTPPALAALDLGTNNCRLLVARPRGDGFEVIDSFSRIVRLGEGVAKTGRLGERAIGRTIAALRACARMIARHGVVRMRGVATEACRQAVNGVDFLDRVKRVTGLTLEILPNEEEARLALLGCLPLIEPTAEHVLLLDIGGGSTEVLWLDRTRGDGRAELRCITSVPIGVVSLSEGFAVEPDAAVFEAMVRRAQSLLVPIEAVHRIGVRFRGARTQLIGTSGTVTTLAAVHLELARYDRRRIDGLTMEPRAIAEVSERLRGMDDQTRAAHPCIGAGRADLVVAGCAILEAILRSWPTDVLRVADRGLREGMLHELMGRSLEQALAGETVTAAGPRLAAAGVERRSER